LKRDGWISRETVERIGTDRESLCARFVTVFSVSLSLSLSLSISLNSKGKGTDETAEEAAAPPALDISVVNGVPLRRVSPPLAVTDYAVFTALTLSDYENIVEYDMV
jgi:hypothetical protein